MSARYTPTRFAAESRFVLRSSLITQAVEEPGRRVPACAAVRAPCGVNVFVLSASGVGGLSLNDASDGVTARPLLLPLLALASSLADTGRTVLPSR